MVILGSTAPKPIENAKLLENVNKYLSLDLKMPINNVNNIFKFQLYIKNKLDIK